MKRILIKLSGGALAEGEEKFSHSVLENTAKKIKNIQKKGVEIAVVVGGGNLFRGRDLESGDKLKRPTADYVGMLGTIQNALIVRDFFISQEIPTIVSSAISMPQVCEPYMPRKVTSNLKKERVVILAGGLGQPYFSTDSAAVQRTLELGCEKLILAKDGVDGVYDSDPKENPEAKKIDRLTCSEILEKNLKVADSSAVSLARENGLSMKVVSMENIEDFDNKNIGTEIFPE